MAANDMDSALRRVLQPGGGGVSGCDPERNAAYVEGRLTVAERRKLETHLAGCPDCRRLVTEWLASEERPAPVAAPAWSWWRWQWAAPALAGVVVVSAVVWMRTAPVATQPAAVETAALPAGPPPSRDQVVSPESRPKVKAPAPAGKPVSRNEIAVSPPRQEVKAAVLAERREADQLRAVTSDVASRPVEEESLERRDTATPRPPAAAPPVPRREGNQLGAVTSPVAGQPVKDEKVGPREPAPAPPPTAAPGPRREDKLRAGTSPVAGRPIKQETAERRNVRPPLPRVTAPEVAAQVAAEAPAGAVAPRLVQDEAAARLEFAKTGIAARQKAVAPSPLPDGAPLRGLVRRGARVWAVSDGGRLFRSSDAGVRWEKMSSPTTADLVSIRFDTLGELLLVEDRQGNTHRVKP